MEPAHGEAPLILTLWCTIRMTEVPGGSKAPFLQQCLPYPGLAPAARTLQLRVFASCPSVQRSQPTIIPKLCLGSSTDSLTPSDRRETSVPSGWSSRILASMLAN